MIGWLTGFHTDVYRVQGEYCQTDTSSLYSFSNKRDRTQLAVGVSKPYTYILGGGCVMKQLNLEGISILQMQIFITAGTELNYTRTANICNITQPTVSRSIDALEKALDVSLLYKRSNRMQLTPAGKVIHSCFKELLCELYRHIHIAHEQQQGIGSKLRITYPMHSNLSKAIAFLGHEYQEKMADKKIAIEYKNSTHTEGLQYLLENRVDIQFSVDLIQGMTEQYSELESCVIMKLPLMAYMRRTNPLSCKRKVTLEELQHQNLIVQKRETDAYCARHLEQCFAKAGYVPTISKYCDFALEGAMNIQNDDEVMIADRFALSFNISHLTSVEIEDAEMSYIMIWRKEDKKVAIVSEFLKYVEDYFKSVNYSIFE